MGLPSRVSLLFLGTVFLVAACSDDSGDPGDSRTAPSMKGQDYALGAHANQDPASLVQEALGFLELGNAPRARDLFLAALALDEELPEAHHFLGRALMGMSKVSADHEGQAGSVGLSEDSAIQEEGLAALRRACVLAPREADYFYWLGRALHRVGSNAEAVQALEQAIELDPQHGMAHKRLGITHLDAGDPALALLSFGSAEKLLPKDPGPPFQIGNLLLEENPEGARDAYRRSIAADISFPGAYNGLIGVLSRLQDPAGSAQAKTDFMRWSDFETQLAVLIGRAQSRSSDLDAQLDVADALLQKNDWSGARDYFMRSVFLDASSEYAHLNLGILNHRLGDDESALKHLEETIFLRPTSIEPRLQLLAVCQALGNQERLTQLLELFDRDQEKLDAPTHLRLASTLHEVGLEAEAEKHYRSLLAKHPDNSQAKQGLNTLLSSAGAK